MPVVSLVVWNGIEGGSYSLLPTLSTSGRLRSAAGRTFYRIIWEKKRKEKWKEKQVNNWHLNVRNIYSAWRCIRHSALLQFNPIMRDDAKRRISNVSFFKDLQTIDTLSLFSLHSFSFTCPFNRISFFIQFKFFKKIESKFIYFVCVFVYHVPLKYWK